VIYFLRGPNSYQALRKTREFKEAFIKKTAGAYLVEEYDGESAPIAGEDFHSSLGQVSLFAKTRLVIFKNILNDNIFKILKENGDFLKTSKDIFVFWAREPEKPALQFFKKYAEKIQEVKTLSQKELDSWLQKKAQVWGLKINKEEREAMIEEAGEGAEWELENELEKGVLGGEVALGKKPPGSSKPGFETAKKPGFFPPGGFKESAASPFIFVEKIFSDSLGLALLALKEAEISGQDLQRLIYPLLWKAKQKKMPDAYWQGILAESAMRRNPKNIYEILERFILAIK